MEKGQSLIHIIYNAGMTEQRRRMTYEEQRAARERMANRQATSGRPQTTRTPRTRTSQRSAASTGESAANTTKQIPVFKIGVAILLVIVVVFAVRMCTSATPINVTINGTQYELRGAKTMQTAIKTCGLPINPGDLISLKGAILEKSAGDPFAAKVNNTETADPNYGLHDGDTITLTDGKDIVEEYDITESSIPYSATISGVGAIHKFEDGKEGVLETKTGRLSGETVEKETVAPTDVNCKKYNANPGSKKVIAFTFDDGPSEDYTASILNILKENDAKATFFCIGTEVQEHPDLVKREASEGHQVCTHSYDHADPVGGTDVGLMSAEGQIDEVVHGMKTITDVLGGEASRVVRMPGGNLSVDMVKNLEPYVDYEIGWNIDTEDWTLPGAEAIYQHMISAEPGDVILCHDGGGDRSETVEALSRALPYLKSKGYSFVTIDELLEYPARS